MEPRMTRRGLIGTAAALTALGATASGASARPGAAALPPAKDEGTRQGSYEEQPLAGPGDWGVKNFRIPALAVAPNGDLLAAFDKRPVEGDAPAPNSIWQRRSTDGGRTWGEPEVVRAGNESTVPGEKTGFSDPSYVVDTETGTIFLFSVFSKDAGVVASVYGNDDEDRMVISANLSVSRDSGRTWEHRTVTEVAKPDDCRAMFASSGAGVQLRYGTHRGRLVQQFAGWFRNAAGGEDVAAYSLYSDDHGETWERGGRVGTEMDENKVAELSDGTLMMNSRENRRTGRRWIALSHDGGETWEDLHRDLSLVDPGNNAQLTRAYPEAPRGSAKAKVLLFSHAEHVPSTRANGTIEVSTDDGATWTRKRVFAPGDCGYSVIIAVGRDEFLLAYEGVGSAISVARLDMDWILSR
ncbi:glycoside hydrolase [Brachybacterium sp. NBEC-018]|uniref:sialidase family protein n=1 Tax=Brachybacterium sp. NBEC-018 TaxID=2996004 RepID=UPI00217525CE|nr:sialidase family protein [Brachybacterium sp. NBEC-018]UVY83710.1 glycoside hydrolase [Brachybacterium sp. NBEC-018]